MQVSTFRQFSMSDEKEMPIQPEPPSTSQSLARTLRLLTVTAQAVESFLCCVAVS